ncbi:MAG TPA: hypothetical protein IAB18_02000 [Candidatus Avisuccinivibrio pullicola]|nr:hypothetical protein [Candidatus Avisuccinivibrio pullicola]
MLTFDIVKEYPLTSLITFGVLLLSFIVGARFIVKTVRKSNISQSQKAGRNSTQIQIGTFNKK